MTTKRWAIVGGVLMTVMAAVGGATLLAQGRPDGFGHGFGRHGRGFGMMHGMRELGLSADQQTQIRSAMTGHRDEFKALGDRVRKARDAEQAAIEQVPVNEGQVRAASGELAAAEADMAVLRARVHEQVFSVLTPDQQTKAKQLQADRAARRAQHQAEWQQRMQQKQQAAPKQ